MLTPEQWEQVGNQAIEIYSSFELEIVEEIASRIANTGYANRVVYNDALVAQEMGMLYQDIVQLVAKMNHQSEPEIQRIFEEAGIKSLKFDDKIYKNAGLRPLPINQSKSMLQLLQAGANKTNGNLQNLCMTTATTVQTDFYNAINKAYLETTAGVKSYSTAIIDAIEELSEIGPNVLYPSGRKMSLESAVRTNVVTGSSQTCGKLQLMRAKELNWDLMELTAHAGARPSHASWQGKIVSLNGESGYLSLVDIGYGEAGGFKGVNCRHDWMPFDKNSPRTYTQDMLDEYNNAKVAYNGKEIPLYEATQIQRRMERQIRSDKKNVAGLQGILTSNIKDEKLLRETRDRLADVKLKEKAHSASLNEFLKQTKLRKDSSRLKVQKVSTGVVKSDIINANNLLDKLKVNVKSYDLTKQNNIQERAAKVLNFDGLPKIMNGKEYQDYKGKEIVRYLRDSEMSTANDAYKNTLHGNIRYSSVLNSQFGRGIYFGEKTNDEDLASLYGNGNGKAINAKIAKNANILEFNSKISFISDVNNRIKDLPEELQKVYKKECSLLYMLDGYDGIRIKGKDYYCIYNRKVLIIEDGD